MKKITILLIAGVLALLVGATSALAILPDNSSVDVNSQDAHFATTETEINVRGGNITNMDINQTVQASFWHAFYGDVVKTIFLSDGTDNVYNWESQIADGWVYFSNAAGVDWTNVAAGSAGDITAEDTALSLTGIETITNTFNIQSHNPISNIDGVGGNIDGDTSYGVNTSSKTAGNVWSTIFLKDGTSTASIYAGEVVQNTRDNYKGTAVDYQIMVPVDGASTRTYNVYAGLE